MKKMTTILGLMLISSTVFAEITVKNESIKIVKAYGGDTTITMKIADVSGKDAENLFNAIIKSDDNKEGVNFSGPGASDNNLEQVPNQGPYISEYSWARANLSCHKVVDQKGEKPVVTCEIELDGPYLKTGK